MDATASPFSARNTGASRHIKKRANNRISAGKRFLPAGAKVKRHAAHATSHNVALIPQGPTRNSASAKSASTPAAPAQRTAVSSGFVIAANSPLRLSQVKAQ